MKPSLATAVAVVLVHCAATAVAQAGSAAHTRAEVKAVTRALVQARTLTPSNIDAAMSGNLCRCGTYVRIREAIKHAAAAPRRQS